MNVWIFDDEDHYQQMAYQLCEECLEKTNYKLDTQIVWPPEFLSLNQDGHISNINDFPDMIILDLFVGDTRNSEAIEIYKQIRKQEKSQFGRNRSIVIVWSGAYAAAADIEQYLDEQAVNDKRLLLVKIKSEIKLKNAIAGAYERLLEEE